MVDRNRVHLRLQARVQLVTFDLGYPSAIASVWFAAMLACVITITLTMRQRDKLEF